ncbi:MAG: hypothetical protein Q7S33_00685 [Nanoarchaeota archaeon]|nr:hypothetical protein [Nanoarchaeota archaeon]
MENYQKSLLENGMDFSSQRIIGELEKIAKTVSSNISSLDLTQMREYQELTNALVRYKEAAKAQIRSY